jgi:hypothetical protein
MKYFMRKSKSHFLFLPLILSSATGVFSKTLLLKELELFFSICREEDDFFPKE